MHIATLETLDPRCHGEAWIGGGYKTGQEGNSSRMTGCEKAEYDEWNVIPRPSREHS